MFNTVSEYIKAGGMETGFYVMPVARASDKAVAVNAEKYTATALNTYKTLCWFPKSKVKVIRDDFYTDSMGQEVALVPSWLYRARSDEGFQL